jgi:hypothetical protein
MHDPQNSTFPLREIIRNELSAVRQYRQDITVPAEHRALQVLVLALCFWTNAVFFLTRTDYPALFIAASFYLNMFYYITLLVPTSHRKVRMPVQEIRRFPLWLREMGIQSGTARLTRLFINAVLINSQTLSLGLGFLFSLDLLLVLGTMAGTLPFTTTIVVSLQCAVIILFYFLVWLLEPFSTRFADQMAGVRVRLEKERFPTRVISALFVTGIVFAIILFLTTIILLPGITVNAFLTQSGLAVLGYLVLLLSLLGASQYFIIRTIHGLTSKAMASRLYDYKERMLRDLALADNARSSQDPCTQDTFFETPRLLLESRIYRIHRHTLAGTFPVFVVELDFSVMLDSTTLTAIRGYIEDRKK